MKVKVMKIFKYDLIKKKNSYIGEGIKLVLIFPHLAACQRQSGPSGMPGLDILCMRGFVKGFAKMPLATNLSSSCDTTLWLFPDGDDTILWLFTHCFCPSSVSCRVFPYCRTQGSHPKKDPAFIWTFSKSGQNPPPPPYFWQPCGNFHVWRDKAALPQNC